MKKLSPSRDQIHHMAVRWLPESRRAEDLRIHTDTSDFFALDAGDIVVLDGRPYLVRNSIREGRFGLEDEIKHWVKRSVDLTSGAMRIIKFVFYERFTLNRVLLHFSRGANWFYEKTPQLLQDLHAARADIR